MNGSCNLVRKIGEFQLCETTPVQLLGISWQSEHVCFLMLLVFRLCQAKDGVEMSGVHGGQESGGTTVAETVEGSNA